MTAASVIRLTYASAATLTSSRPGVQPVTPAASARRRWYVLIALAGVYALSIADRYVISTVLEPIREELRLSDSGIAFLTGVAVASFYLLFGFPIAWAMDRANRRTLIAASVVVWSAMTASTGLAHSYWQLLLSRFGVGIGESGATPGANSLISDYFPAARRPMALTVFSLGAPLGAWLGADVASRLADQYGWRSVFLALGVPGVLAGVGFFITVREPPRAAFDGDSSYIQTSMAETLAALGRNRAALHLIAACGLTTLWGWGLMWWIPTYLVRSFQLSAGQAGSLTAPMHLYGGMAATAMVSWLVTRRGMQNARAVLYLLATVGVVGTLASIPLFLTHSLERSIALLWVFVPSIYVFIGPGFGLLNNLAQPGMRAVFSATSLFVANIANLVVAPQLVGLLSDGFGAMHMTSAESLRLALLCLAPTGFWAAFHFVRCNRHIHASSPQKLLSYDEPHP